LRTGEFWPDDRSAASVVRLARDQRRRKLQALKAFKTQEWVPKVFGVQRESYREAPTYDFRRPPPPQAWYYDAHGWPISGRSWLRAAEGVLDRLESQ
jgi:N-acetylglucosamine malate deacetylase 2